MSHPLVAVIGPSGCGKTTVGSALAKALGVRFLEGDSLHRAESIAKMAAGRALGDADRWPWLRDVGRALHDAERRGQGLTVACSALKRAYRAVILTEAPSARFILLDADRDLLWSRLAARRDHFMPTSLIASQLEDLEPLTAAEPGRRLDAALTVAELVAAAREWIRDQPPPR